MKRLLTLLPVCVFLVGCSTSTTVEEQVCTISDKRPNHVSSYECGDLEVEDQDIWEDLTIESQYRLSVLDNHKVVGAKFLSNPQTTRIS